MNDWWLGKEEKASVFLKFDDFCQRVLSLLDLACDESTSLVVNWVEILLYTLGIGLDLPAADGFWCDVWSMDHTDNNLMVIKVQWQW